MNKNKIIELLPEYNKEQVEAFAAYAVRLSLDSKNPWMKTKQEEEMANLFKRVSEAGMVFDGVHITLQSTGISYDYIAYKNKMLLAYPESKVDMALVYEGDDFSVAKESGSVIYHHNISSPFDRDTKKIIGAYCIIQNKRGDFITLLSKEELDKHRKVAKTDYIWAQWFSEMALKTVIKKACKQHFDDIYEKIEKSDNENFNLDNPLDLELKYKQEIDAITTMDELKNYYNANKGKGKDFDKYVSIRKSQLS